MLQPRLHVVGPRAWIAARDEAAFREGAAAGATAGAWTAAATVGPFSDAGADTRADTDACSCISDGARITETASTWRSFSSSAGTYWRRSSACRRVSGGGPSCGGAGRRGAWVLSAAIDELPADYRTAFLLHDVEGLPNPEIAETLDVKLGTIKSRVHRARLFLRRRLADYVGASLEVARS